LIRFKIMNGSKPFPEDGRCGESGYCDGGSEFCDRKDLGTLNDSIVNVKERNHNRKYRI